MDDPTSEIRAIPGFDGFFISRSGIVYSEFLPNGTRRAAMKVVASHVMQVCETKPPYHHVHLIKNGEEVCPSIHRLLLLTFVGPPPPGTQCRHLDGNSLNNSLGNLAWGTPKENNADQIAHGTRVQGERHPQHKLTVEDVLSIRSLAASGYSSALLGAHFKVHRYTIDKIIRRDRWAWLQ